jgi:plastocyanin
MRLSCLVGAAVVVAGCGGGSGGNGGTNPPTPVANVSLVPSATATAICGTVTLTATPRDAQGNALSRTVDAWGGGGTILDLSSATGATNTGTGVGAGIANITASSGGQTSPAVAITVTAAGTPPATQSVSAPPGTAFSPACVELATGGSVTWTFGAEQHNVQFSGPQPTGGNIGSLSSTTASRTFPTAGNYRYQCTLHAGMNGRVVVR